MLQNKDWQILQKLVLRCRTKNVSFSNFVVANEKIRFLTLHSHANIHVCTNADNQRIKTLLLHGIQIYKTVVDNYVGL